MLYVLVNITMNPTISKSQYVRGLQCEKALWLFRNRKDLLLEPSSATKNKHCQTNLTSH